MKNKLRLTDCTFLDGEMRLIKNNAQPLTELANRIEDALRNPSETDAEPIGNFE